MLFTAALSLTTDGNSTDILTVAIGACAIVLVFTSALFFYFRKSNKKPRMRARPGPTSSSAPPRVNVDMTSATDVELVEAHHERAKHLAA